MAEKRDGTGLPAGEELLATLRRLCPGATAFRPEQEEIITSILSGRDTLAILPTGGGKSVCYQVPALHMDGLTLVISPLLALMEEQTEKLRKAGVRVACLSSEFMVDAQGIHRRREKRRGEILSEDAPLEEDSPPSRRRRDKIYQDACNGAYQLLYVTPERLRNGSFLRFARRANISLIAVDEAHCVSLWGHQFRPRYREISRLIGCIGCRPVIAAFTATATRAVREDIVALLGMRRCKVIGGETLGRPELQFSVRQFFTEDERRQALLQFVKERRGQCGYVYCNTVNTVKEIFQLLLDNKLWAARYYAELDEEDKERGFRAFVKGDWPVMVCTSALGMGIDKPDVRYVLHYNMPPSLEDYYQQAGRAGRDGKRAECVLYYRKDDEEVCRSMCGSTLGKSDFPEESGALMWRRLGRMEHYARDGAGLSSDRLQKWILNYFASFRPNDETERALRKAVLKSINTIDVLYVNRAKITQRLRKGQMEGRNIPVGRAGAGRSAPTVSYQVTGEALSYFDLMVADGAYTLIQHRVSAIYAKNVMELLSGDDTLLLRPSRREAVEASIRKMTRTRIRIDRRNSMSCGFAYADQRDKEILSGPFLPLVERERGFSYDPDVLPPLYEYAEIFNGQFFTFPAKALKVKGLPATDRNLTMTHYLLCRIGIMPDLPSQFKKGGGVTCHTISFPALLDAVDPRPPGSPRRKRDTQVLWERMLTILKYFKKRHIIAGYEETPYRSVRIRLHIEIKNA